MKQGNSPQKIMGVIAMLGALLSGALSTGEKIDRQAVMQRRNNLILNFGGPAPRKVLNQRQKRKRYRQSHHCT